MPTYTDKKIRDIIAAYHKIGGALEGEFVTPILRGLEELSAALSEIDKNEYTQAGKELVATMAWYHRRMVDVYESQFTTGEQRRRMKEHHLIYRSDVIEAEAKEDYGNRSC